VAEPLRRYVARRTDPETAKDVLADTLLVLWRRLDHVPAEDPLPWSYGVARRCLANAARSSTRHLRLVDRLARQPVIPPAERPERDEELHRALDQLSVRDREIVRLWAWEELEPREIAVVLGITANAASIRLHRAKRKLAELLRKDPGAPGQEEIEERRPR
jgi:RNA polymerase sigma-70 factor (ECF subfamily)